MASFTWHCPVQKALRNLKFSCPMVMAGKPGMSSIRNCFHEMCHTLYYLDCSWHFWKINCIKIIKVFILNKSLFVNSTYFRISARAIAGAPAGRVGVRGFLVIINIRKFHFDVIVTSLFAMIIWGSQKGIEQTNWIYRTISYNCENVTIFGWSF